MPHLLGKPMKIMGLILKKKYIIKKQKMGHLFSSGKGGMSDVEYQTMFALWCLVKSPLMLGTDMTNITR